MTYNIHSGVGLDKRYDLGRIRRVLINERPDIAGLQELECGSARTSNDDRSSLLAAELTLKSSFCATRPAPGDQATVTARIEHTWHESTDHTINAELVTAALVHRC